MAMAMTVRKVYDTTKQLSVLTLFDILSTCFLLGLWSLLLSICRFLAQSCNFIYNCMFQCLSDMELISLSGFHATFAMPWSSYISVLCLHNL